MTGPEGPRPAPALVRFALALIRLASRAAPAEVRERMRREWEGELHAAVRAGERPRRLVRQALGAFHDARALRALHDDHGERGEGTMSDWAKGWIGDWRAAVRGLVRAPVFTGVAVLTLALGLGGSAAIYTLLERVVLDPLPYPEADRLVRLMNQVPGVSEGERWNMSTAQYVHLSDHSRTLEAVGVYQGMGANLHTPDGSERVNGARVSREILPLLGARARIGRILTAEDDSPGALMVAVVSHGFWTRALGADPAVVGRSLSLNDQEIQVVGVLEPGTAVPGWSPDFATDIWLPLRIDRAGSFGNNHVFPMIGRMAPGVDPATVEAEIAELTRRLPEAFPNAYSQAFFDRFGFRTEATDLRSDVVGDIGRNLWILFGAVGLVLLIACANVANLFLVRMEGRRRELSVRAALGAGRARLSRYLLAEGLALAGAGGALALLVGWWAVPALTAMAPADLPRVQEVGMGAGTILFTLALTLVVGLGLALHPIVEQGRRDSTERLNDGARGGSAGPARSRFRSGLVVVQVALALVLVVSAGLLVESMRNLARVDAGIEPEGVLALNLHASFSRYPDGAALWQLHDRVLRHVEAIPGVRAAGMGTEIPVQGGYGCTGQGFEDPEVYTRLESAGMTSCAGQVITTPGYLEALGIPLLQGRSLERADLDDPARGAVVVSRAFAERFWPGEDPIGKGVAANGRTEGEFSRVVGVVGDVPAGAVDGEPAVAIYYPMVQDPEIARSWGFMVPTSITLVVKTTSADPSSLFPAIRQAVGELDPQIALSNLMSMDEVIAHSMSRLAFTSLLLGLAAGTALLLAAVGLYGVVSYTVSRRTREIGMRIAIGAGPGDVERMIVRGTMGLTAMGLVIGLAGALAGTRMLEGLLFGVEPGDPVGFAAGTALIVAVTAAASWIPARRAARVDPAEALREA